MSTDHDSNSDFDVLAEANDLRTELLGFNYIEAVSEPRIRQGESGQYVRMGVRFTDDVEHKDVKLNNEIGTYLQSYFGPREDWWFTNDMSGYFGVINTFGLNPRDINETVGSHEF